MAHGVQRTLPAPSEKACQADVAGPLYTSRHGNSEGVPVMLEVIQHGRRPLPAELICLVSSSDPGASVHALRDYRGLQQLRRFGPNLRTRPITGTLTLLPGYPTRRTGVPNKDAT